MMNLDVIANTAYLSVVSHSLQASLEHQSFLIMRLSSTVSHGVWLAALAKTASAAFGYTEDGDNIVIDAGSNNSLVFSLSKSSCDLTSILYRQNELQYPDTGSHLGSGLGESSTTVTKVNDNIIKVTCVSGAVTHYTVVRKGDAAIYMGTHIEDNSFGELRYIARLNNDILSEEHPFGDVSSYVGYTDLVEGEDVVLADGQTRSKFYSAERYIDRGVHCVYGSDNSDQSVHVCMLIPQPESSSGGPFFRDIETSNGDAYNALHNYMWSAHTQIEATQRVGFHGPYAMVFSSRGVPRLSETNFGFFDSLGCKGYVANAGRGHVSGRANGVPSGYEAVIHWYNDHAQYWTRAGSNGEFTSPAMKPGTYRQVLYQTEYKVAEVSAVRVTAGSSTSQSITTRLNDEQRKVLFKIGRYDGQPFGFKNSDKQLRMHPSDDRMEDWVSEYTVGKSAATDFPMAIFKDVNDGTPINFELSSVPAGGATLRIATTLSFAASRPSITVNDWESAPAEAPDRIDSRGVTRGVYRGLGEQYDFEISAEVLKEGANTIKIYSYSGNSSEGFLSPNFVSFLSY